MNTETIFVLLLTAVAAGFLAWLEIHSRRNRDKLDEKQIEENIEHTPEVPIAAQPRPQKRGKSR